MPPTFAGFFSLEPKNLAFLASLESQLIEVDTAEGMDSPGWLPLTPGESNDLKGLWVVDWESGIRSALFSLDPRHEAKIWNDRNPEFLGHLKWLQEPVNRNLAILILTELSAFRAYWPRKKSDKECRGLFFSDGPLERFLEKTAKSFNLPESFGKQLREKIKTIHYDLFHAGKIPGTTEFQDWRLGGLDLGISFPFWSGLFEPGKMPEKEATIFRGISSLGAGFTLSNKFNPLKKQDVLAGGGSLLMMGLEKNSPCDFFTCPESIGVSAAKLEVMIQEVILKTSSGKEILNDALAALNQTIQFIGARGPAFQNAVNVLTISCNRLKAFIS